MKKNQPSQEAKALINALENGPGGMSEAICNSPYCGRPVKDGEIICDVCKASWDKPKFTKKFIVNAWNYRTQIETTETIEAESLIQAKELMMKKMSGGDALKAADYIVQSYNTDIKIPNITEQSKKLFIDYAKDAGNWNGTPLLGGNVGGSKEDRGNLTQLKRAKLITTFRYEGNDWIQFTDLGQDYAASLGIYI